MINVEGNSFTLEAVFRTLPPHPLPLPTYEMPSTDHGRLICVDKSVLLCHSVAPNQRRVSV